MGWSLTSLKLPRRLKRASVRDRLSVTILVSLTLTALITLSGGIFLSFKAISVSFKENARRHTETLSTFVLTEFYYYDIPALNLTLKNFGNANVFARIEIYDRYQNIIAEIGEPANDDWHFVTTQLKTDDDVLVGELHIWYDSSKHASTLKRTLVGSVTLLVLSILFLGGTLIRRALNREVIQPIKRLRDHVTQKHLDPMPLQFSSQEFQDLSDTFNLLTNTLVSKASTDELTGLYNRRRIIEILNREVERAQQQNESVRVFYIDLDKFKQINDHMGHAVGDALLVQIGQGIKAIQHPKLYMARLGGDEFLGVQCQATAFNAIEIIDPLTQVFNRENHLHGFKFKTSGSGGYATFPKDGKSAEEIMQNADIALYQAKADGRRRFMEYTCTLRMDSFTRFSESEYVVDALEHNKLRFFFQDIVDAYSYYRWGAEALMRLQGPQGDYMNPQRIISLAMEHGLLDKISRLTVDHAVRYLQSRQAPRNLSLNFSREQLLTTDIGDYAQRKLKAAGLSVNRVVIEVTEDGLLEDDSIQTRIDDLAQKGLRIALDDFGSGQSALACIRDLPLEIIKLDKSLLKQTSKKHEAEMLFSGIVSIAHQMNCTVIAEGVETEEDMIMARRYGCELVQGFYLNQRQPSQARNPRLHLTAAPP